MTYEEDDQWCWENYPRWRFSHNWNRGGGIRTCCFLSVWWPKRGPIGITLLNFVLEFNPYYKKESE